ncbi:hypothetical protein BLAT2472_20002 [Burkholderia latens]
MFPSSAAFSAAEKRDYEPPFFARQQLSELLRCDREGFSFVCPGPLPLTQSHRFPSSPAPRFR